MKKLIIAVIFVSVLITSAFGQNDTMLNLNKYASYFLNNSGRIDRQYRSAANSEVYDRIAALGGDEHSLDTSLEIALLSNTVGVVNISPVEANEMLGTPRQAALKLGAAVLMEIQILRFLGNTRAVGLHETELKFITDRGNVTRAEVEAFYRSNIRFLISEIVDEEFGKVSFRIDWHNATLTRNQQNGSLTLSYGGVNTNNETRFVTANSLEALLSAMRNGANRADFTSADLDTVRTQAARIPAVLISADRLPTRQYCLLIS